MPLISARVLGARFGAVSSVTLGGGGLGQVWGETSRKECVATVRRAVELGVTLLDMAPMYGKGEAENVIGEAFDGKLPDGVRIASKCMLGRTDAGDVEKKVRSSLQGTLKRMRLKRVDLLLLHSFVTPDDFDPTPLGALGRVATIQWTSYVDEFIPAVTKLKQEGLIGDWGISGIGFPDQVLQALAYAIKPAVVQVISNPLDSAGELTIWPSGQSRAREIGAAAVANGVGIMGIRVVNGGALTDSIDRKLPSGSRVQSDFDRAAPVRQLAKELGMSTAFLALRYAFGMHEEQHTVVLGVKNRRELEEAIAAARDGPLGTATDRRIDEAVADVVVEASSAGTVSLDPKAAARARLAKL
eukprot:gene13898-4072_t